MRATALAALAVAAGVLIAPSCAEAGERLATPSTFASVYEEAEAGDTILLASGAYGSWEGGSKSVTLKPQAGASPTMGLSLSGSSRELTFDGVELSGGNVAGSGHRFVNVTFTDGVAVRGGAAYITFEKATFNGLGVAVWEGRLSLNEDANHITVKSSHFGGGGCSDGIFVGNVSDILVQENVFTDLLQGSCEQHVDAVQFYGESVNARFDRNVFYNNTTGLMEYDGGSTGTVVTNNVFREIERTDECLTLAGSSSPRVEHNTALGGCTINFGSKPGQQTTDITSRNNVAQAFENTNTGDSPTFLVDDYNLSVDTAPVGAHSVRCTPVIADPEFTTPDGAALTPDSPCGYHAGSDGESMGVITQAAGAPPTETPTPTPPVPGTDADGDTNTSMQGFVVVAPAAFPLPSTMPALAAPARASGLVASFGFDEASGSTAVDNSGFANKGKISGARRVSRGKHGKAMRFDGFNDIIKVADSASLDLTTGMTLEAWVRPTALSTYHPVLVKTRGRRSFSYMLYARDKSKRPAGWAYTNGEYKARSPAALPTRRWTHLAVTFDGSTLRFFVNGVHRGAKAVAGPLAVGTGSLRIGGAGARAERFKGDLDDVRIWSKPLQPSQIEANMSIDAQGRAHRR